MCLKLVGNNPLFLCLSVGVSTVLILEVILGCLEALKFSHGNNLSIPSLFPAWHLPCPGALQEMEQVRFPHPFPLGNILLAHGSSSGSSHLPEHHSTALQCRACPHLSQLLISCHLALSFHICVYHCFQRQNPCDSTTTEIKASKGNKTLKSVFSKGAVAASGCAEPPTHLEHPHWAPARCWVPGWGVLLQEGLSCTPRGTAHGKNCRSKKEYIQGINCMENYPGY